MNLKRHFIKLCFSVVACVGMLTSCAHSDQQTPEAQVTQSQDKVLAEFERANSLLDNGQNEQAAKAYDSIVIADPTSQLGILIIYNAGIAYFRMQDCVTAVERLRKVIRMSQSAPAIKAQAMQRISDAYTCAGEDSKAITNLVELYQGQYRLDPDVQYAELPVKLAAAYARVGNNKQAEKYYKAAEHGLVKLQNFFGEKKDKKLIMARTLYTMGSTAQLNPKTMSSEDYFNSLKALQKYLYQSAEYGVTPWSERATDELMEAYARTWVYVDKVVADVDEDKALEARQIKEERSKIVRVALAAVLDLQRQRIPSPDEPESLKIFNAKVQQQELKFKNYLAANSVETELTAEAKAVSALKREGRVNNPNPVLEKKAMQKRAKVKGKK